MFYRQTLWVVASMCTFALAFGCSDNNNNGSEQLVCTFTKDCPTGQRCDDGVCSTQTQTCTSDAACGFDEYCASGTCKVNTCADDAACQGDGYICDDTDNTCRLGCRTTEDCGDGETCNSTSNTCQASSECTPTSCPLFQRCDTNVSPASCEPTGACDVNDVSSSACVLYGNFLDDGEDYICGNAGRCIAVPPCGSDSDCDQSINEICVPRARDGVNACRGGCRDDTQCSSSEFCDQDLNLCQTGCAADADCLNVDPNKDFTCVDLKCIEVCEGVDDCPVVGQVCQGAPKVCRGCITDDDCPATKECDFALGSNDDERDSPNVGLCVDLPPTCPEDGYGNNTSLDRAFAIPAFPFQTDGAAVARPLFCQEFQTDGEWFAVAAVAGDVIVAKLDYVTEGANLDLKLRNPVGDLLASSTRPPTDDNGKEEVRYGVTVPGTYLLFIDGQLSEGKQNIEYNLDVNVAPPAACTDDAFEDNDIPEDAKPLVADMTALNLQVCSSSDVAQSDRDFFSLDVANNQIVTVGVSAPVRLGTLAVVVTDASGSPVATEPVPGSDERVQFSVEAAAIYTVEVQVENGVGNVDYSIQWTQRDNECADIYEDNNTAATATPVTAGTFPNLKLCPDTDWYAIELSPLQTITVNADYDPNAGQGFVDLRLRGPNDPSKIIEYDSRVTLPDGTYRESFESQVAQGGTYYIAVTLEQGLNIPYDLDIQVVDGPPCAEDIYEDNDTYDDAFIFDRANLASGQESALLGLRYCDTDEDFYGIDLAEGESIRWVVAHDTTAGDLDVEIVGPGNTVRASGTTTDQDEDVTYTVPPGEAGKYTLRVLSKNAVRNEYRVLTYLNGVGPEDPDCPDIFENNDTAADAATVTPGNYNLLVCYEPGSANDDWFTTCLSPGETLNIDLAFTHANGNINLDLLQEGTVVAFSRTFGDTESLSYTATQEECLTYHVFLPLNGGENSYNMNMSIDAAPACNDDSYEDNDTRATAVALEAPGLYDRLSKCEDDEDWFEFSVTENQAAGVYINFDDSLSDVDVELYRNGEAVALPGGDTTGAGEELLFTAPDDASTTAANTQTVYTYSVLVKTKVRARLSYDLLLYRDTDGDGTLEGPQDKTCPDAYEDNDIESAAKPFSIGTVTGLLSCWGGGASDNDYYSIFVPGGATLTVDLSFDANNGNIDASIRPQSGGLPIIGNTTNNNETLSITNSGSGQLYNVRVYGGIAQTYRAYYDMQASLTFADQCMEDMTLAADEASAPVLASDAYDNLTLCEGTEDWGKFDALSGDNVFIGLESTSVLGDIDLEVLNDAGVVVASASGTENVETLNFSAPADGTYSLRVYPKDNAFIRNAYDLYVQVGLAVPPAPFCPDDYERNDTLSSAAVLNVSTQGGQTRYTDMIACGADADWYSVTLIGNSPYALNVFFDQDAGQQLDITVQNSAGVVLATGSSVASDELVSFMTSTSGQYFIGITNVSATPDEGRYFMSLERTASNGCLADSYEPNNTAASAKPLPDGGGLYALSSCTMSDEEYFNVIATQSGTFKITVSHDSTGLPLLLEAVNRRSGQTLFGSPGTNRQVLTTTVQANDSLRIYVGNGGGVGSYFMEIEQN